MAMGSGAGSQVTEAEMLAAVSAICDRLDPPVVWLHLADSRRAGGPYRKGLPDLFLVGRHRSAWRELKAGTSEHGGQRAWRYLLTLSRQDAGVWRRAADRFRAGRAQPAAAWPAARHIRSSMQRDRAETYFRALRTLTGASRPLG